MAKEKKAAWFKLYLHNKAVMGAAEPPRAFSVPPSEKEVRDYCRQMCYTFDPEGFWDYYTAIGWRVGNSPTPAGISSASAHIDPRSGISSAKHISQIPKGFIWACGTVGGTVRWFPGRSG